MEWSHAKAVIARRVLSRVLADKVLLGMEPAVTQVRSTAAKGKAKPARGSRASATAQD